MTVNSVLNHSLHCLQVFITTLNKLFQLVIQPCITSHDHDQKQADLLRDLRIAKFLTYSGVVAFHIALTIFG